MPIVAAEGALSSQGYGQFARQGAAVYIEDVFSTWLYTGNGLFSFSGSQTINNGIDFTGKGGMLWVKSRSANASSWNYILDTMRGIDSVIYTNSTSAASSLPVGNSFTSSGFSLSSNANLNGSAGGVGDNYVSWSFRKQPKFFDVVTYTGDGANNKTISHALGSTPGCIIVKRTDNIGGWVVYHRGTSVPNNTYLTLQTTNAATNLGVDRWSVTGTTFNANNNDLSLNESGATYVAYLFAHDAGGFGLTGTDNVITCGSFTTNGSGNATVGLGYEPQWVMVKATSDSSSWQIFDVMRGYASQSGAPIDAVLQANASSVEILINAGNPRATGFVINGYGFNTTGIYIAIRRGPMKTPTSGTSVFSPNATTGGGSVTTNFPVDTSINKAYEIAGTNWFVFDRLRGAGDYNPYITAYLNTNTNSTEQTQSGFGPGYDDNLGFSQNWLDGSNVSVWYNFRRAPGFFDEVCYTGTGSTGFEEHNLGVKPQLSIVKNRSSAGNDWQVSARVNSIDYYLRLNTTNASNIDTEALNGYVNLASNDTTSTIFRIDAYNTFNAVNASNNTYVAYLFASCPGVSKVGSYTGTGSTLQIDCGFTGGARFVLIKRTDSSGDWFVWNSARGIVSGNDPYLRLNSTAAEVTNTDWVDTHSPGFELSNAGGNLVNVNGGTYLFLAIA